jgi:hypothetical protein
MSRGAILRAAAQYHLEESKPPPSPIDQPELNAVLEWTKPREPPVDKCEQLKLNRQYRQHQRALWDEYRHANEKLGFRFPWRITDLVTLGSPLTYA